VTLSIQVNFLTYIKYYLIGRVAILC